MTVTNLESGTVLSGTYEILREIGAGGMGAVYEAKHLRLHGRRVAVKVLLKDAASDEEAFARFKREAEIGARLGHPNIVAVTDFDKLPDGSPFLVMEMLDGEDLAKRMSKGRVPESLVWRVLRETGSALAAAHKQGIVHRDLKPHNLFLTTVDEAEGEVEHVKVLDFGISKIVAASTVLTRDAAVLGTPRYMAPEQALGKHNEIDGRADQFALATVAYELLTGRPAFDAETATAVLYKVVYEAPARLAEVAPSVPAGVVAAIERAMSKAVSERYPDVNAFVAAVLDGAGVGGGVSFARAGGASQAGAPVDEALPNTELDVAESSRRAASRRRTMWIAAALGLVVAVGAGVLVATSGPKKTAGTDEGKLPEGTVFVEAGRAKTENAAAAAAAVVVAAAAPVAEAAKVAAAPVAEAAPAAQAAAPAALARAKSSDGDAKAARGSKVAEKPEASPVIDEAESLYKSDRHRDAVTRARQSLGIQETPRARRIIALAYCAQGDLGNAKAAFLKVSSSDKRQVIERCKQAGIDL